MSNRLNNLITEFAAYSLKPNDTPTLNQYVGLIDEEIQKLISNGQTWGRLSGLPAEWARTIFEIYQVESPVTFYRPAISYSESKFPSIGETISGFIQWSMLYKTNACNTRREARIELNHLYLQLSNILYHKYKENK